MRPTARTCTGLTSGWCVSLRPPHPIVAISHGTDCTPRSLTHILRSRANLQMNSVILFFPYRFGTAFAAHAWSATLRKSRALALRTGEKLRKLNTEDASADYEQLFSLPAAAIYAALCAAIFFDSVRHTERFAGAFPTGHSRSAAGTMTSSDIALYVGGPGLYPVPPLALMAAKRRWGHSPAMVMCSLALPFAFTGHAVERLVVDLRCEPSSLLTQPTAVFHAASALAIVGAYVQSRALQMV